MIYIFNCHSSFSYNNRTDIHYTTGTINNHLFKLLLVPANVLENNGVHDIVAVITIGLESAVRNVDSVPKLEVCNYLDIFDYRDIINLSRYG